MESEGLLGSVAKVDSLNDLSDADKQKMSMVAVSSAFFSAFALTAIIPLVPIFHENFDGSFVQLGLFMGAAFLGMVAALPVHSVVSGQVQIWKLLAAVNGLVSFSALLFIITLKGFFTLAIVRLFIGAAFVLSFCCAIAFIDALYPPSARSGRKSVVVFFAVAFGLISGPLIGGALASPSSIHMLFGMQLLFSAGAGAGAFHICRAVEWVVPKQEPIHTLLNDPHTLLSAGMLAATGFAIAVVQVAIPMHVMLAFSSSPSAVGGLVMIIGIASVFTVNIIALSAGSFPVNKASMLAPCIVGVFVCMLILPSDLAATVVPVLLLGASMAVTTVCANLRLLYTVGEGGAAQSTQPMLLVAAGSRGAGAFVGSLMYCLMMQETTADDGIASCGAMIIILGVVLGMLIFRERRRLVGGDSLADTDEANDTTALLPVVCDLALVQAM